VHMQCIGSIQGIDVDHAPRASSSQSVGGSSSSRPRSPATEASYTLASMAVTSPPRGRMPGVPASPMSPAAAAASDLPLHPGSEGDHIM